MRVTDDTAARYDPLTGLYKTKYLRSVITDFLHQAEAIGAVVGLIFIDIDKMKAFNDQNGKPSGNILITSLAQITMVYIPTEAIAVRYSGDEFLVVITAANEAEISACANEIREAAKKVNVMGGSFEGPYWPTRPVTLTLGLSFFPRQGRDFDTLIIAADKALNNGKRRGGDCCVNAERRD